MDEVPRILLVPSLPIPFGNYVYEIRLVLNINIRGNLYFEGLFLGFRCLIVLTCRTTPINEIGGEK